MILPGMSAYFEKMPKPILDGGYYVKTKENRPLIGPMPVEGSYVVGALSGYGIMASNAAGDLLSSYIVGDELPAYAGSFSLDRYDDPDYRKILQKLEEESWEL
jgi:glycine/D-amino acid oxidase-like deaminating enzyme